MISKQKKISEQLQDRINYFKKINELKAKKRDTNATQKHNPKK